MAVHGICLRAAPRPDTDSCLSQQDPTLPDRLGKVNACTSTRPLAHLREEEEYGRMWDELAVSVF